MKHHEVPTHLNVEDKLLFGLTARQFLYLLVGGSAGYTFWEQSGTFSDPLRAAVVCVCACAAIAFAFIRPTGRSLEEWVVAAIIYVGAPRRSTWQPREPDAADWRPSALGWRELTPSLTWAESEEGVG
jgi:hypothetical protein